MRRADRRQYFRVWMQLETARKALPYWIVRLNPRAHVEAKRLQGVLLRLVRDLLVMREVWEALGYRWPDSIENELGRYPTEPE